MVILRPVGTIGNRLKYLRKIRGLTRKEAEHPPDRKASEKFHRPAYQAGKLIETQGQQLWHGDVTEYIARKYKIGDDANGEETGREQCKKRERQEENLSQGIQKTWEENQEDRIRD